MPVPQSAIIVKRNSFGGDKQNLAVRRVLDDDVYLLLKSGLYIAPAVDFIIVFKPLVGLSDVIRGFLFIHVKEILLVSRAVAKPFDDHSFIVPLLYLFFDLIPRVI